MSRIARICKAAVLAALVATPPAMAQENPLARPGNPVAEPSNPLAAGNAASRPAAVPAWMKRGARVTYLSSSAMVPGETEVLVPDAGGRWVGRDGRRFSVGEARGNGAMSYNQYTFLGADERAVVADHRTYQLRDADPNGRCTNKGSTLATGTPAGLGPIYVSPAVLAGLQTQPGGATVTRGPFPWEGKTYTAVTRETRTGQSFERLTYDLESGLLLVFQYSMVGGVSMVPGANGVSRAGKGTTSVGTLTLAGVRQLEMPWPEDGFTRWAAGRTVNFRGVFQTFVPGGRMVEQAAVSSVVFGQPEQGWVSVKTTTRIDGLVPGAPPLETVSDGAGSPHTGTPYWIDPAALRRLKPGQVIDQDPVTKYRVFVAEGEAGGITLVEEGPLDRSRAVYDPQTGMATSTVFEVAPEVGGMRMILRAEGAR